MRVVILALLSATALGAFAENVPEAFEAANRLYLEQKYSEAATTYGIIEQAGQRSAALYFNWGNALFKSGQLGRAIVAYRHAQELSPRDPDIRANLQFARGQRQGPTLSPAKSQQWLRKLSVNEWAILAAIALWVFFGLLTMLQFRPHLQRSARPAILALGIVMLALCGCAGAAAHISRSEKQAVVIVAAAPVRNGPLDEAQDAFALHDGAEVAVLDRKNDWLQIEIDGGRTGWIKNSQIAFVN